MSLNETTDIAAILHHPAAKRSTSMFFIRENKVLSMHEIWDLLACASGATPLNHYEDGVSHALLNTM